MPGVRVREQTINEVEIMKRQCKPAPLTLASLSGPWPPELRRLVALKLLEVADELNAKAEMLTRGIKTPRRKRTGQ